MEDDMEYFKKYTSNTVAASGNQYHFISDGRRITGRVFYKITNGGKYGYSLLFSNIMDSTFADGSISNKNMICDPWTIHSARVARCGKDAFADGFTEAEVIKRVNDSLCGFVSLTFDGKTEKQVAPGEFFCTDEVELELDEDEYLCLEMEFSGSMMPHHEESLLPVYIKTNDGWEYNVKMPLPGMIGCNRPINKRVVYVGDSITQGIGTPFNSYLHWNALLSKMLGDKNSFWNLGLGYARANDMASLGAWAYKAKHCDAAIVCYGVNDVLQGFSAQEIKRDIAIIVKYFKSMGKTVILQTLPPFDYNEEKTAVWHQVNDYVRSVLAEQVELVFDTGKVLSLSEEEPQRAKYVGHPNEEGSRLWAEALYPAVKELL